MSQDRSLSASILSGIFATAMAAAWFALLVVFELIAAMLAYMYLALFNRDLFGYLIGLSHTALNTIIEQMKYFFPDSANAAYATVAGELAPKAMLLLLIGLVVGAALRFVFWLLGRLLFGSRH